MSHDEREQRPGRTREHEKRATADEHDLQRVGMHHEAHPDPDRAQESFGRQRALVMLAPPANEHCDDAEIRQRVEDEHQPGADGCNQHAGDTRSDRSRRVDGDAVQGDCR